jgi:hypothetical protein
MLFKRDFTRLYFYTLRFNRSEQSALITVVKHYIYSYLTVDICFATTDLVGHRDRMIVGFITTSAISAYYH